MRLPRILGRMPVSELFVIKKSIHELLAFNREVQVIVRASSIVKGMKISRREDVLQRAFDDLVTLEQEYFPEEYTNTHLLTQGHDTNLDQEAAGLLK